MRQLWQQMPLLVLSNECSQVLRSDTFELHAGDGFAIVVVEQDHAIRLGVADDYPLRINEFRCDLLDDVEAGYFFWRADYAIFVQFFL